MMGCHLGSESRGMLSSCAGNWGGSLLSGEGEGKGAQGELLGRWGDNTFLTMMLKLKL